MALAGEAAGKLDLFCDEISGIELVKVTESRQYEDLRNFYLEKISKKFEVDLEGDEAWSEDYHENEKILNLDTEKLGVKDFETVRKDKEYELFYIRQENGHPYFNVALLRNIKLVCDFEETVDISIEEDPLLRIRAMQDRDLHGGAQQVLKFCEALIQKFFKSDARVSDEDFPTLLNRCVMALMLTSNPKNLIQNTSGKSSLLYFSDFLDFLRKTLKSNNYKRSLSYLIDSSDQKVLNMLNLVHLLCEGFFTRRSGIKEEMIGFIYHLIHQGKKLVKQAKANAFAQVFWNKVIEEDEAIRSFLKCYPNGPLFKILDLLRNEESARVNIAFDPIEQENHPYLIYKLNIDKQDISVIRLPFPTTQSYIHKAEIVNEFLAFLRSLSSSKSKYLVINLQNKTSWKDYARCAALEKLCQHAEFSKNLFVVAFPKETDFYYQVNDYFNLNSANDFLKVLDDQIKAEDEAGFYFKLNEDKNKFLVRMKDLVQFIYKEFFDSAKELKRKQRLDFIEIFYNFLTIELIQILNPTHISFTCKDAIDISAAANASFYLFTKLLSNKKIEKHDKDTALWLYYSGALLIRERAIDNSRLSRTLSFLDYIDEKLKKIKKDVISKKYPILKKIKIID